MHIGQFPIDDDLVRTLVSEQFPEWSHLPLERVASDGTVHAIYRLGPDLALRLPLHEQFVAALEREAAILPLLAPHLPQAIPEVVTVGEATDEYPSPWTVVRWIDGTILADGPPTDMDAVAEALGTFVNAMGTVDLAGEHSPNQRGRPIDAVDAWTRKSIAAVEGEFDVVELTSQWEAALAAPSWDGEPRWIHGDLLPGNLIVSGRRLAAVIDFGECAIGNPTYDLIAGWWVFDAASRAVFRAASGADDASWARARGCALSGGVGALAYYVDSNPGFAEQARRTIQRVLDDE